MPLPKRHAELQLFWRYHFRSEGILAAWLEKQRRFSRGQYGCLSTSANAWNWLVYVED
jgi:hypothetical protein